MKAAMNEDFESFDATLPKNYVPSFLRIEGEYFEAPSGLLENSPVCLLGPPGSGKTTTLLRLVEKLSEDKGNIATVFVPCRHVREQFSSNLREFLLQHEPSTEAENLKSLDGIAVILDGLDEIHPDARTDFVDVLESWILQHPSTYFILSSRIASFRPLKSVTLAEIDSDSDAYIKAFIEKAIPDQLNAQELLTLIQGHESLRSLAGSPFFLNLLVSVYLQVGAIPDKLSDFYSAWTDTVLRTWDKSRGISRSAKLLSLPETRAVLSALALRTLRSSNVFFTYKEWHNAVSELTDAPDEATRKTLSESVIGTGIVVQRGVDTYSFAHLTIHEYFAALALLDLEPTDAFTLLSESPFEGIATFYAEMTPYPGRFAAFLLDCDDLDAARRVIDHNPRVNIEDKKRLIALAAEKLGVGTVSFEIQADDLPSDDDAKRVLRYHWMKCIEATSAKEKGDTLEEFARNLFGDVFEVVDVRRHTQFGEIDLICEVKQAAFWQRWPGDCFVECKNQKEKTGVDIANEFAGKCSTIRLALAFLLSVQPLTRPSRDRLARSWGEVGTPDMAWLDGSDISKWLEDETDAESLLKRAVRRAGYGITL
jgi:Holliday junction resolvase-like predicted endonuclease